MNGITNIFQGTIRPLGERFVSLTPIQRLVSAVAVVVFLSMTCVAIWKGKQLYAERVKKQESDRREAHKEVKAGYALLIDGKAKEANDHFTQLATKHPNNTEVLVGLSDANEGLNDSDKSTENMVKAIKLDPELLKNPAIVKTLKRKSAKFKHLSLQAFLNEFEEEAKKTKPSTIEGQTTKKEKGVINNSEQSLDDLLAELDVIYDMKT